MAAPETGLSVVNDALLMAGIIGQGQQPSSEDLTQALRRLNGMISQWSVKRWMVFRLAEIGITSTGQTTPYTVGPGGQFNVAVAPNRIENAFVRQLSSNQSLPVDTRLQVVQAREQYDLATLKLKFISYPSLVYLDTTFPTASLYVYPWPNSGVYQIFISMKDALPIITATTLMSSMPGMYLEAMKTNLAKLLRQAYGKGTKPDPELNAQAKNALNTVKNANIQVPELLMPNGLAQGGTYNIYSDGYS